MFSCARQLTAYAVRISDCSSHVCSSDLLVTGSIDLGNRIRKFESVDSSAVVQPLAMPCQCKDLSAIGTLPLEHAGCIVQCVSKNMDVCFTPRDQLAIKPDPSITVIIGAFITGHAHFRSEEHTSELMSLLRTSYAVFRLKQK